MDCSNILAFTLETVVSSRFSTGTGLIVTVVIEIDVFLPVAAWTTGLLQSRSHPLWSRSIWRRRDSQSWGWRASARADRRRTEPVRPSHRSPPPPPFSPHPRSPPLRAMRREEEVTFSPPFMFITSCVCVRVCFSYQALGIQPDRRTCQLERSSSFPVNTGFHQGGSPAWWPLGLKEVYSLSLYNSNWSHSFIFFSSCSGNNPFWSWPDDI